MSKCAKLLLLFYLLYKGQPGKGKAEEIYILTAPILKRVMECWGMLLGKALHTFLRSFRDRFGKYVY